MEPLFYISLLSFSAMSMPAGAFIFAIIFWIVGFVVIGIPISLCFGFLPYWKLGDVRIKKEHWCSGLVVFELQIYEKYRQNGLDLYGWRSANVVFDTKKEAEEYIERCRKR